MKRIPRYYDLLKKEQEMDNNFIKAIQLKLQLINKK